MSVDLTKYGNNTPPRFKYVLDTENGVVILKSAPVEWAEINLRFKRNMEFDGVFTESAVGGDSETSQITFIDDGRRALEDLFDDKGLFAQASLKIYYLDYTTRTNEEMPTSYKLDFNTYKEVKYSESINAVRITALPVTKVARLLQRKGTDVDLTKVTSLDGFVADLQYHWNPLISGIVFPEINAHSIGVFEDIDVYNWSHAGAGTFFVYFPQTLIQSDFTECQDVSLYEGTIRDRNYSFFKESTEGRTFELIGTLAFVLSGLNAIAVNVKMDVIDNTNNLISSVTLGTYGSSSAGSQSISISETVTLSANESVIIYADVLMIVGSTITIDIVQTDLNLDETITQTLEKTVQSIPIYEALERNLQLILSEQYPLYSVFFGRTTVAYNVSGDMYGSEDQEHFANILNGLCVRGLILSDNNNSVATNFSDLFKTCKALWNVGGGFEEVAGELKFRIEERAYWYEDTEILDLSDRVNLLDIEKEVLIEMAYARIKTGFSDFEYESTNGRGEYNTLNKRTTEIPNDIEFDNVAPYRGDTRGLTLLLEEPITKTGTDDVKGDEDIFIVKSQKLTIWAAETDENITVLNNTSLFQEGSLNLYFTPVRNLLRHNYVIMAGLGLPAQSGTYVRFQTAEKNNSLETTDGVDNVVENEDIAVSTLGSPRWDALAYVVKVDFYQADYQTLKANPKGYIKLADNIEGWVLDVNWKMASNKATLKLLAKWV